MYACQFFAVSAEVRADERGLEEGGAGGGEDHLVRPDAVGGSVVATPEFDEIDSFQTVTVGSDKIQAKDEE